MPDLESRFDELLDEGVTHQAAMETCLPDLLAAIKTVRAEAATDIELERRLAVQLGGDEVRQRLDVIVLALRSRAAIEKARTFGRAARTLSGDSSLGVALQSMPLRDPALTSLLMHVLVGQFSHPSRLITAASLVAGKATEEGLRAASLGPLGEAILAHAQNQLAILTKSLDGFGDTDMACRSLDRFHQLVRATSGYLDLNRTSRWSTVIAELTKLASNRVEPRLREISSNVSQSMRRSREGAENLESDRLLAGISGMYLLVGVREARESLALNTLFEQVWNEVGQALDILVKRSLEEFRANPTDLMADKRLETGIKMAELRFNAEYADVLRKARNAVSRRTVITD